MADFPLGNKNLKLAMLGMVEGNGHPYSWSIIVNGRYDAKALANCPYAVIRDYIAKQPPSTLGIEGAEITHVWTDDPGDAKQVAQVAGIEHVVAQPKDVIGQVDAVLIATDKGEEHVERCRPFVEAGIPVFVDKPLCNNHADLGVFSNWVAQGKPIISSSAMRYSKEFAPYHRATSEFGALRHISFTMAKSWETYGIHALEAIYPIVGPGFVSVQNLGDMEHNHVHLEHRDGVGISLAVVKDLAGGAGLMTLAGTQGGVQLRFIDTYHAFKTQLVSYVNYLRSGVAPVPFEQTRELMHLVIAGIKSRNMGGQKVFLKDLEQN